MPVGLGVNGGVLGVNNLPGSGVAKGVWTLNEQFRAQGLLTWPGLIPPSFDYLVVAGGASGGCGGASGSVGGGGGAGGYRTGTISTLGSGQLFTTVRWRGEDSIDGGCGRGAKNRIRTGERRICFIVDRSSN